MKSYFSENIHSSLGNNSVLDQFDTAYPASFYGSTQDDFITGTFLVLNQEQTKKLGKEVYDESNRGRLFSKAYTSSQPALDSTYGSVEAIKNPSYAERLVPWSEKVSHSHRIVHCYDENERIYDTCLPGLKQCFLADDSNPWFTYDNSQYWLSPYGNIQNSSDTGYILLNAAPIATQGLSNNVWTWSFPYEDRYKPSERLIDTRKVTSDLATSLSTNWYPITFSKVKEQKYTRKINNLLPILPGRRLAGATGNVFKVDASLPDNGPGTYRFLIPSDINLNNKSTPTNEHLTSSMSNDDMIKFMFGFGDLNNITYTSFTLNDDEDEEKVLSSSYYTGFEIINFGSYQSSSFLGSPILPNSSPYNFNQFNYTDNYVNVKWQSPIGISSGQLGYVEYPWVLVATSGSVTASFDEYGNVSTLYNYVSASNFFAYASGGNPRARGQLLTGSSAIYWLSSSNTIDAGQTNNKDTHWVLGSFLSSSIYVSPTGGPSVVTTYSLPDPISPGGKTVSSQKLEITSSLPWKLSYSRAISAHISDYFRSSFTGMPGLPSSLGNVDVEIETLYGTDVPFEGTSVIETTPQILTEFTSSLYPPGEYQVKFSYVKKGVAGSQNSINRAFIDNVYVFTLGQNQLTASFDPKHRIGYGHYPEFRQIIRDTRTSPYFPGIGLKSAADLSLDIIKKLDVFNPTIVKPKYDKFTINLTDTITKTAPSLLSKTTAIFNVSPNKITTISQLSTLQKSPIDLAKLSIFDEVANYLKSTSYGGYEIAISPVIRGWKYGIYNGFPAHSRIVFRRNRFGQFRDMLEQRLFTKFCNTDVTLLKNVSKDNKNLKPLSFNSSFSVQDGPVSVKFVQQTAEIDADNFGKILTVEIDPLQTTSQNITKDCSSSVPYFDGESRSRPNLNDNGTPLSGLVLLTAGVQSDVLNSAVKLGSTAVQASQAVKSPISGLNNLTITSKI